MKKTPDESRNSKDGWFRRNSQQMLLSLAFSLLIFWQMPFSVFKKNFLELSFSANQVLQSNLSYSLLCFVICFALFALVCKLQKLKQGLESLFWFMIILFWLEGNILSSSTEIFDGRKSTWHLWSMHNLYDAILAIVIAGIMYALRNKKQLQHAAAVVFCITLFADGALNYWSLSQVDVNSDRMYMVDNSKDYSFSKDRNIIVMVWDESQSDIFQRVLDRRHDLAEKLKDFNFYTDTTSSFQNTIPSIPMILSGLLYDNSENFSSYMKQTYLSKQSIFYQLKNLGYERHATPLVPRTFLYDPRVADNIIEKNMPLYATLFYASKIYELSLYAMLPYLLERAVYKDGRWAITESARYFRWKEKLNNKNTNTKANKSNLNFYIKPAESDRDYHAMVTMVNQINNSIDKPLFKFIHFLGLHTPFNIDENGHLIDNSMDIQHCEKKVEYKLYLMGVFIDLLKKTGVYDNSMLVFLGDHGSGRDIASLIMKDPDTGIPQSLGIKARANPMLMVKFMNAHQPTIVYNKRRMSLQTLTPFIIDTVTNQPIHEPTVRRYTHYNWDRSPVLSEHLDSYQEWVVSGHVRKDLSWSSYHVHEPGQAHECMFEKFNIREELNTPIILKRDGDRSHKIQLLENKENNLGVLIEFVGDAGLVTVKNSKQVWFDRDVRWREGDGFTFSAFFSVDKDQRNDPIFVTAQKDHAIKRIRLFGLDEKR
jgi:hypothetical protein